MRTWEENTVERAMDVCVMIAAADALRHSCRALVLPEAQETQHKDSLIGTES